MRPPRKCLDRPPRAASSPDPESLRVAFKGDWLLWDPLSELRREATRCGGRLCNGVALGAAAPWLGRLHRAVSI